MPNRDGTGPNGQGPRTGRQMGNCENAQPICRKVNQPCRRGIGNGRGLRNQNK
jgi:hypothetical protein